MAKEYRVVYRRPERLQIECQQGTLSEAQWLLASLWRVPLSGMPFREKPEYARIESREVSEWQKVEASDGKS